MPKTSLERQLEKNRLEAKRQADKAQKAEQKRLQQEKELAYKEALRQEAASIVVGQEVVDGFRLLDINAEKILNCLIEHCDNLETGHVNFKNDIFPGQFQSSIGLELEKLTQYGMLTVYTRWMGGGIVNLLPAAFAYHENKERAMLKKAQSAQFPIANNYYGNTNVIEGAVSASTIIAGDKNTVSGIDKEQQSEISKESQRALNITNTVFISHRSTDKAIADMLLDFLVGTGVPRDVVFCSSLPGNDIKEKISGEVKKALQSSKVNIAILSKDYYESAYCLNEAGILWFLDDSVVIPLVLPEITHDKMIGFLDDEYKTRSLDNEDDIAYIYDAIIEKLSIPQTKAAIVREETKKLTKKYDSLLSKR